MRIVWKALLVMAVALAAFGYWGMFTQAGGRNFDEMDGMIPFFAAVASPIVLAMGTLLWWRCRVRVAAGD